MLRGGRTTWVQVAAVLLLVLVAAGVLLAVTERAKRDARSNVARVQIADLHKQMILYVSGSRNYFPGIKSNGRLLVEDQDFAQYGMTAADRTGADPSVRLEILSRRNYVTAPGLVSPMETLQHWDGAGPLRPAQFSFAMLMLSAADDSGTMASHPRNDEWKGSNNSLAVVLADRNLAGDDDAAGAPDRARGLFSPRGRGWRGHVVWNDNHVSLEMSPIVPQAQYGKGLESHQDNIFQQHALDASLRYLDAAGALEAPGGGAMSTEADAKLIHADGAAGG